MKRPLLSRILACALSVALLLGMCTTAFAYKYPSAYWKLHSAWESAESDQSIDQILSVAQKTYELLSKDEICQDICWNLQPKSALASWCAEIKGDLDAAITWAERELVYAQWLHDNGDGYDDILLDTNARLEYLRAAANPAVYVLTDQAASIGGGAPSQGTWYGSDASGSQSGESAVLFYVTFQDGYSVEYWMNYYADTFPKFKSALNSGDPIELAWNVSPETTASMEQVLSADSYIAEAMAALGKLNNTILLRLGAEMNNWYCDPDVFQQAFRKVANEAHKYGNIKMVFSPDNVSNRNVTFADYYPGDEYVDWIGMSTYHNSNFASQYGGGQGEYAFGNTNYTTDSYYGVGVYDSDPLIIFAPVVRFAQEHNKPMMISECGFSATSSSGADQSAFAVDQLNKFYSYVNMVYPQVKAVFYFDVAISGSPNSYLLSKNPALATAYRDAIANNGAYLRQGETDGRNWKRLDLANLSCKTGDTLKLAAYAPFPGSAPTTVKYYVDDQLFSTVTAAPYYLELDTSTLYGGKHTVRAEASSGQFTRTTASYEITVDGPAAPDPNTSNGGSHASDWAVPIVNMAEDAGLVPDWMMGGDMTQDITRADYAAAMVGLYRAMGGSTEGVSTENPFTDVTPDMPAYEDIILAGTLKLVAGKGDGLFDPNGYLQREEAAVMLVKVCLALGKTVDLTSATTFADNGEISDWALGSVAFMNQNGVFNGKENNRFAPQDQITCEESLTVAVNMLKKLK